MKVQQKSKTTRLTGGASITRPGVYILPKSARTSRPGNLLIVKTTTLNELVDAAITTIDDDGSDSE